MERHAFASSGWLKPLSLDAEMMPPATRSSHVPGDVGVAC